MLVKPTIETLLTKVDNRYVLAMLAAKRARQLTEFAQPLVEVQTKNVVSIAAEELAADKLAFVRGEIDVYYPKMVEPEFGFKPENPDPKGISKEERAADNEDIEETSVMDYSANHASDLNDMKEQSIRGLQYTKQYMNILSTENEDESAFFKSEFEDNSDLEKETTALIEELRKNANISDSDDANVALEALEDMQDLNVASNAAKKELERTSKNSENQSSSEFENADDDSDLLSFDELEE